MNGKIVILSMALVFLLCSGCGGSGGGTDLVVEAIRGHTSIFEFTSHDYTVTASGDTGITYLWACDPASAGILTNGTTATATFTANAVTADTSATITLTVTSDNHGPEIRTLAITITDRAPGWAGSWGGLNDDSANDVSVDTIGNVYTVGSFAKTPDFDFVDFDPGAGEETRTSNGMDDVFLSKLDTDGNLEWVRTWGGPENDAAYGVTAGGLGNIYVTGTFRDTVDFDPSGAVAEFTSNGLTDIFLTQFDSDGNYVRTLTWGGTGEDTGYRVTTGILGSVCVVGSFNGDVDFDPGVGTDNHSSEGSDDAFLVAFDSAGVFSWAVTWGGVGREIAYDVETDAAGGGDILVSGDFEDTVDFDPDPVDTDNHTVFGAQDSYISRFDSSGDLIRALSWGGPGTDRCKGIATGADGATYGVGTFYGDVDFDPGPGETIMGFAYHSDIYISKFDSDGIFEWVQTINGNLSDIANDVVVDSGGNAILTGFYTNDMPLPFRGIQYVIFKFDPSGTNLWGNVWTAHPDYDAKGCGITVDGLDNIYTTGNFWGTIDFNPDVVTIDSHTAVDGFDAFVMKLHPDGTM